MTLGQVAEWVGGEVVGDEDFVVDGVRSLESAGSSDLAFLSNPKYRKTAESSAAGALLAAGEVAGGPPNQVLVTDPYRALSTVLQRLAPANPEQSGIHPSAVVDPLAQVADDAWVGPLCSIGVGARVGSRTRLVSHVALGPDAEVGVECVLFPFVSVYRRCVIGDRVRLHSGVVIGSDGFGYASDAEGHHKIPHLGIVRIQDDVEIGANTAVDRAVLEETVIGAGTKIDNLAQVGHNARLGAANLLVAQTAIAGSAELGDRVVMAGHAGVAGHLKVGNDVQLAAKTALYEDAPDGSRWGGSPAIPLMEWKRLSVRLRRLGDMERKIKQLEHQLREEDDEARQEGK